MSPSQAARIAALNEAGYDARPHPCKEGIQFSADTPPLLVYRSKLIARAMEGKDEISWDDWLVETSQLAPQNITWLAAHGIEVAS